MLDGMKRDMAVLRDGHAGTRFQKYRQHMCSQRDSKRSFSRVVSFVLGWLLVIGGLAIGWLPGPGGFIAIIGLAMLSREVPGIACALDFCEVVIRGILRWFGQLPLWIRLAMGVLIAGVSVLLVCSVYRLLR